MFHSITRPNPGIRSEDTGSAAPNDSPRWQLTDIYSGLNGADYARDKDLLTRLMADLQSHAGSVETENRPFRDWLLTMLKLLNETSAVYGTLNSYAYACFSVDTGNPVFLKELNVLEALAIPLPGALARMRLALAAHEEELNALKAETDPELASFAWTLQEMLLLARHQMSPTEEDLAADLARSGSDAFTRLQETLSASLQLNWKDGTTKTIVELRGLAHSPDREIRRAAFELETSAWHNHRLAFAASLNGVKGTALTLARRRGWKNNLEQSLVQSRISKATLDSLISAMKDSLPDFRRYMKAKARLLGQEKLAFFDLFAPLKGIEGTWTFAQARDFIIERFATFSSDLSTFATMAFDKGWIDAQPRPGKVGGAYCIDFPLRGQTRIMSNFTGNFDSIITIAHELGHAWHSWLLVSHPVILRDYPMTLAETASLFCETLVYKDALANAQGDHLLALLEMRLSDINQIITDILSRFLFESDLFARREHAELSAEELCDSMLNAQKQTYGEGLDPEFLHPYMWAVKGHYYHAGLNYYNFPYAFGQLFGLGLFAQYQQEPASFEAKYQLMLKKTGELGAVELCHNAGMDIESPIFWTQALDQVRSEIKVFCDLAQSKEITSGGRL